MRFLKSFIKHRGHCESSSIVYYNGILHNATCSNYIIVLWKSTFSENYTIINIIVHLNYKIDECGSVEDQNKEI